MALNKSQLEEKIMNLEIQLDKVEKKREQLKSEITKRKEKLKEFIIKEKLLSKKDELEVILGEDVYKAILSEN